MLMFLEIAENTFIRVSEISKVEPSPDGRLIVTLVNGRTAFVRSNFQQHFLAVLRLGTIEANYVQ